MGMNTISTLIVGIVMTTMVGTQVAPSIIEQIKTKKVQTQTINNQEVIFEAIKRYTTIKQVAPTSIQDLIDEGYLEANVNNNGFGEEYTINIDKALGVATITTTIEDPKVQEAFLNSFTSMSKPTCTGTIENIGAQQYNYVKVKVIYKDENGDILTTDWGYAVDSNYILRDETVQFEISTKVDGDVDTYEMEFLVD